ncbi:MAG TPA: hypothetical protein VFQ76_07370, partial [Longimicrobiaceae bacterium]|nr:hypothetical protein [Longimicrobiaceae bacterium]
VRFRKHFREIPADDAGGDLVLFHDFVELSADEREGRRAFVYALDPRKRLTRLAVSREIVQLAEDRLGYWSQLRELAGLEVPGSVRDGIAAGLEAEFDRRMDALRAEYEAKLAEVHATYPAVVARRLAEGLIRGGGAGRTVAEILLESEALPDLQPIRLDAAAVSALATPAAPVVPTWAPAPAPPAPPAAAAAAPAAEPAGVAVAEEEDEALGMEPYIETARCTSCNECTGINGRMFAYNAYKQAVIRDPRAGTFAQLVQAAERCPAGIIHPGTPLNPKEKDLEKWMKRAERFN